MFGFRTAATAVSAVRVARELDDLAGGQAEDFLELGANVEEDLAALLGGAALAASHVPVAATRDALAYGASPDANAEESLADVDDDAHDLAVLLLFEGLADGGEHDVEPEVIDANVALLLELVRPFAAVLVLRVLPLGADASLEEVVIGLECEFGNGRNVVLRESASTLEPLRMWTVLLT